jgi:hypothetical protein
LAQASRYAQQALDNVQKMDGKIYEYGPPEDVDQDSEGEFVQEIGAEAADKSIDKDSEEKEAELDDTREEQEQPVFPEENSPKKER